MTKRLRRRRRLLPLWGVLAALLVAMLLSPFGWALSLPAAFLAAYAAIRVAAVDLDRRVFAHLATVQPEQAAGDERLAPLPWLPDALPEAGFVFVTALHYPLVPDRTLDIDVYCDEAGWRWCEVSATGFDVTSAFGGRRLITSARSPKRATPLPDAFLLQHAAPDLQLVIKVHDRTVDLLRVAGVHPDPVSPQDVVQRVIADTRTATHHLAGLPLSAHLAHQLRGRKASPQVTSVGDQRLTTWTLGAPW